MGIWKYVPPPAKIMPENTRNNLKIFQKWWGKRPGISIYAMDNILYGNGKLSIINATSIRSAVPSKKTVPTNGKRVSLTNFIANYVNEKFSLFPKLKTCRSFNGSGVCFRNFQQRMLP